MSSLSSVPSYLESTYVMSEDYQKLHHNPLLINCIFSGNNGEFGGGIYNNNSDPVITNCVFAGNVAFFMNAGARWQRGLQALLHAQEHLPARLTTASHYLP